MVEVVQLHARLVRLGSRVGEAEEEDEWRRGYKASLWGLGSAGVRVALHAWLNRADRQQQSSVGRSGKCRPRERHAIQGMKSTACSGDQKW